MKIYLDNSTITRPSQEVVSEMIPFLTETWGSPIAPHRIGNEPLPFMKDAYQAIYNLFGACEEDHFVFTSSGTEAVNHVIMSAYTDITISSGKNHFITSVVDEAPQIMGLSRLEKLGCVVSMVEVNKNGCVTIDQLVDHITPRTALISLSWGGGLTGTVQEINEIAALCKDRGILFHIDASHIAGKTFASFEEIGADCMSFEGSLLHGPQGAGGLFWKKNCKLSPFILGGNEQGGNRGGPINVASLMAMGKAAREAYEARDFICMEGPRLRGLLENKIVEEVEGAIALFKNSERLPTVTCIAFPNVPNETLLYYLNQDDLYASIGGGNFQQLGIILEACGVDPKLAHSSVSFALSRYTTDEEIMQAVKIIGKAVKQIRNISHQMVQE